MSHTHTPDFLSVGLSQEHPVLPCVMSSSPVAQQFWTPAFGTRDRNRPGRHLMAEAISRPGHTLGSGAAAGSVEQAHRFPFANRKGVGKAKPSTRGERQVGCAGVASPLPCCLPHSLNQGSRVTTLIQSPIASGCWVPCSSQEQEPHTCSTG